MSTLKFKTSVKCGGCIQKITPNLNNLKGIISWKVDTQNPDRILEVEADNLDPRMVIEAVKSAGYQIEQI
jgi:copper chaperone